MQNMSIRLNFLKVMLVLYLRNLEDTTLTKRVYLEPRFKGWPGVAEETVLICQYLQIEDCNLTKLDKEEYRKRLLQACHVRNEQLLRNMGDGKCARLGMRVLERKNI